MKPQKLINYITLSKFALYLFMCCMLSVPALAQLHARGATINNIPDTGKKGNTWAVIVGISKYQNVAGLNYADKDALAFYDYLLNKKGIDSKHIQLLINEKAIASDIYGALDWLNLSIKENDRVIFYFSGHGDVETKTIYQNGFLLANDAPVAAYMTKGTINITFLQQYLETYIAKKAKDVILIVDACRSGKLAGGSQGIQITMHSLGANWNNQIIKVLSAQEGESSFEDKKWGGGRGVFSYYLVKGLEGLANRNADSVITTAELAAYLPYAVGDATGAVQNPTVNGNPKTNLFTFNSALLALANQQDSQAGTGQALATKGTNDELDPEIERWYSQYRTYLQKGRLIWGEKQNDTINCAKYYYLKLVKDARAKTLLPSLKSSFFASLKRKMEIKLDEYIKGKDFDDPNKEAYKETLYAKSLIDPSYILYNYLSARLLFMEGYNMPDNESAKAVKWFRKVIQIEPDAAYAYHELGIRFGHYLDIPDSAVYYYKKALALSPTWAVTENNLGNYFMQKNNFKDAVFYLEKSLALDSTHSAIYLNLILSYSQLYPDGKKADSIEEKGIKINKALIEKDSTKTGPMICLAQLLSEKGDHKSAINYLIQAFALNHKDGYTAQAIAWENVMIGNTNEAIKYFKIAIQLSPKTLYTYLYLGNQYVIIKNYAAAIESFKKQIELAPAINDSYVALSDAYLSNKQYTEALKVSNAALNVHSEKPENYSQLGKVYSKLKNYPKAVLYYHKAIALDTATSDAFKALGDFYHERKDFDNCVKTCLEAVKLHKEEADLYYRAAVGYSLKNDSKQSLKYLEISIVKGHQGFGYLSLKKQADLANVRKDPGFDILMKKYFPNDAK